MSDYLTPQCNVGRIVTVDDSCGCAVTRAKLGGLSPDAIIAFGDTEIELAKVIANHAEASILGVPETAFDSLMMGSLKNIKPMVGTMPVGEQSLVLPYIMRPQPSVINQNFFSIEAGVVNPNAGVGNTPASAWDVTINLGASPFKSDLKQMENLFLPGTSIIVHNWNSTSNKTAQTLALTVLNAVNADSAGVSKAKVTVIPPFTSDGWNELSPEEKAVYQPTFGLVILGDNNVSNYERWCHNEAARLSRKLVVNYMQTKRLAICTSSEYRKTLEAIMGGKVNEYYRKFRALPEAEQNKQRRATSKRRWYNSLIWGQGINEHQDPDGANWQQLPKVLDPDPANPDCPLEIKAANEGFYTKLKRCGRVIDHQGGRLNLDALNEALYLIKRNRAATGAVIDRIEMWTDRWTADLLRRSIPAWLKSRYGLVSTLNHSQGNVVKWDNVIQFNFDEYDIPVAGVRLAVIHDQNFDDLFLSAPDTVGGSNVGFSARGRMAWLVDFSDWKIGIAGQLTRLRKHPNLDTDPLYECIMDGNPREQLLESTKFTSLLDVPARHLILENFNLECPYVTGGACSGNNPPPYES